MRQATRPRFPNGYGDPRQVPLYPQATAELMAGRRMLSATRWEQPSGLDEVVVGPATAVEIRWLQQVDALIRPELREQLLV